MDYREGVLAEVIITKASHRYFLIQKSVLKFSSRLTCHKSASVIG